MSRIAQTTTGTCALCHETHAKSAMSRHLEACLARRPASARVRGFHLLVEAKGAPRYWMHLAARADAKLSDLDAFLRDAWLECCDHCSAFRIAGRDYDVIAEPPYRQGMARELSYVLRPDLAFGYEYDFGTTTELHLRVLSELPQMPRGDAIQLLALNTAPSYPCELCSKPAEVVDTEDVRMLCKPCANDVAKPEMCLPLVNSPRAGVCGYTGPPIEIRSGARAAKPRGRAAGA